MAKSATWRLRKGTETTPYKIAAFNKAQGRQRFFDTIQELGNFLLKEGATQETAAKAIADMNETGDVNFTIEVQAN